MTKTQQTTAPKPKRRPFRVTPALNGGWVVEQPYNNNPTYAALSDDDALLAWIKGEMADRRPITPEDFAPSTRGEV